MGTVTSPRPVGTGPEKFVTLVSMVALMNTRLYANISLYTTHIAKRSPRSTRRQRTNTLSRLCLTPMSPQIAREGNVSLLPTRPRLGVLR